MRILTVLLITGIASAQIGWKDLGSATILHNALGPGGITVQDCTGAPPPAYCTGNVASYSFHALDHYVVDDQSGAAFDAVHNCMYVFGGGHNNYSGNQVYEMCQSNSWTMVRLTDPSGPIATSGNINPDNTMPSTHTGQGMVYMPNENAFFVWGIGLTAAPSPQTTGWWFSLGSNTWIQKGALLDTANGSGQNCVLDTTSATESILCTDYQIYVLYRYTPGTDTWTALTAINGAEVVAGGTCAIDPNTAAGVISTAVGNNGPFLICAGATEGFGFPSGIYAISIAAGSSYAATNVTSSTTGCSAIYGQKNPGFKWDSVLGTFVAFTGAGGSGANVITFFDPVTGLCRSRNFNGGPVANSGVWGLYDRFSFFPSINSYIAFTSPNNDVFSLQLSADSLGGSFINSSGPCKDIDGDGYGVGAGCLGIDADDNDATVHSSAQIISKYGSIQNFLLSIGYQSSGSLSNVRCVSTTGNNSTGVTSTNADTACAMPFLTSAGAISGLTNPYIIIFRAGTWTVNIGGNAGSGSMLSGTAGAQNVIMAYPGEQPVIDTSGGGGSSVWAKDVSYLTVDGFRLKSNASATAYAGGSYILYMSGSQTITFIGDVLTRCEMSGGGVDSNVDADNVTNFTIEENVVHDPYPMGGQHNIYIGSSTVASSGVAIRRNILYNVNTGGYPSLQFNGRCNACYFEQNIIYNSDGQEIALLQGVTNSFVRNNLVFNTGTSANPPLSLTINNYNSGQCQMVGLPSICAWDQTNNVIENNTFWTGTTAPYGGGTLSGPTVEISNTDTSGPCGNGGSPPCGTLGGNFYRNNIIVGPGTVFHGSNSGYSPVVYPSASQNYLASDIWVDNIINSQDGSVYILGFGPGNSFGYFPYNCTSFNSMAKSGSSGCSTASPLFVNAATSNYNSPQSFNFKLQAGSPALAAGTGIGAPVFDIIGSARATSPSLGTFENSSAGGIGGSVTSGSVNISGGVRAN